MEIRLAQKIIIALDVKTGQDALTLVDKLDEAKVFKVGLELFTAEGPTLFDGLKARQKRLFLDLKLHDIPNTVAGAVSAGTRHGIQMMTLHAAGGREMMIRAREAAETGQSKEMLSRKLGPNSRDIKKLYNQIENAETPVDETVVLALEETEGLLESYLKGSKPENV